MTSLCTNFLVHVQLDGSGKRYSGRVRTNSLCPPYVLNAPKTRISCRMFYILCCFCCTYVVVLLLYLLSLNSVETFILFKKYIVMATKFSTMIRDKEALYLKTGSFINCLYIKCII